MTFQYLIIFMEFLNILFVSHLPSHLNFISNAFAFMIFEIQFFDYVSNNYKLITFHKYWFLWNLNLHLLMK